MIFPFCNPVVLHISIQPFSQWCHIAALQGISDRMQLNPPFCSKHSTRHIQERYGVQSYIQNSLFQVGSTHNWHKHCVRDVLVVQ